MDDDAKGSTRDDVAVVPCSLDRLDEVFKLESQCKSSTSQSLRH